ncbi:hypothetical protein GP486_008156 [Trichoglossum hirsutum]|uniref:Uncharacterized protein n=1 Tax=Trichoglossum hirsutum TaxID=265104 RepID=A0A9P8L796_9PEZI|nr:hypothetical protein GP486_008156 [Trichoglossum hirsutum]
MSTLAVPDTGDPKIPTTMASSISMAGSGGVTEEKDVSAPATANSQTTTLAADKESDVRTEVGTNASRSTKGDEEEYPKGITLLIISIALCLAVFLVALPCSPVAEPEPT